MTVSPGRVVVLDEVEPITWTVERGRVLLRSEDTGGVLTFMELTTPAGGGPPTHLHDGVDETLFVTAGCYQVRVGDRSVRAEPGTVVHLPRGLPHGFRNIGGEDASMLCIATPGGVEQMFEGLAALTADGPPDRARIAALVAQHDITYV